MARVVIVTILSLSAGPAFQSASTAQSPEPGTYRIWMCAAPCTSADSAKAVATATVVILDDSTAAADPVRAALATLPPLAHWARPNPAAAVNNACFRVTQRERKVGTEELFFGITPNAVTRWQSTAEGYSMLVYRSPDANYTLRWTAPGALTSGEGWSSGPGPNGPFGGREHRNAYFAATRLGPPDPARCE